MVGLVLVSHSATLAQGVAELAGQMAGADLRLGVAAGLDQPGRPLGTDASLVARVIDEVWSEDGVLVLMDLGSAVLSAEMALELIGEKRADRVLLTEAPLVEGAVAAAVAAALGEPLERVAEEARGGLRAKAEHLTPEQTEQEPRPGAAAAGPVAGEEARTARLSVTNRLGLHARPAALLVQTAAGYDADVTVTNVTAGRGPASARSLNGIATLGARHGDEILVRASGPQADEALAALRRLAEAAFGEPEDEAEESPGGVATAGPPAAAGPLPPAAPPGDLAPPGGRPSPGGQPSPGTVLRGLPASSGIAVGPARHLRHAGVRIADAPAGDPEAEWTALAKALAATASDIRLARRSVAGRAAERDAAIFDAHLLFLEDEALLEPAHGSVRGGTSATRAWSDSVSAAAAAWEDLDDPYLRARAADLRSVGDQVLHHLAGTSSRVNGAAGVVITGDLTPAETAALGGSSVEGVACAYGGPTGHGAILARSMGIPAVVGAGAELLAVAEGTPLALDGGAGTVTVDPPPAALRAAEERRAAEAEQRAEAQGRSLSPAVTKDGVTVLVAANIAGPADATTAVAAGADGVGLLRTEFLFLEARSMPSEETQERAYRQVAEALAGRPLTIRTLDAGADKPLPYLPSAVEANPFLGVRGIRLALLHPGLLLSQFRAALRVAADHPVRIMLPMVTTVDEVLRARGLLDQARSSLAASGIAVPERPKLGIMVEVPAVALTAEAFAPHVDFFSVGTNDLTQYVLAAERGNAGVAALADPLHPAVLHLIGHTARAATKAGRPVAVCGEVAGDASAIPILLGLGVGELSVAAPRIPFAKQAVRCTDASSARKLALAALAAGSADQVRRLDADPA